MPSLCCLLKQNKITHEQTTFFTLLQSSQLYNGDICPTVLVMLSSVKVVVEFLAQQPDLDDSPAPGGCACIDLSTSGTPMLAWAMFVFCTATCVL